MGNKNRNYIVDMSTIYFVAKGFQYFLCSYIMVYMAIIQIFNSRIKKTPSQLYSRQYQTFREIKRVLYKVDISTNI